MTDHDKHPKKKHYGYDDAVKAIKEMKKDEDKEVLKSVRDALDEGAAIK